MVKDKTTFQPRTKTRSDFSNLLTSESAKYGKTLQRMILALYLNGPISKLLGNDSFDPRVLRRNSLFSLGITVGLLVLAVLLIPQLASDTSGAVYNGWRIVIAIALVSFMACGTTAVKIEILKTLETQTRLA